MSADRNVFFSDIERGQQPLQNNLYDLLDSRPVKPYYIVIDETEVSCDFKPKNNKIYIPRKRLKLSKVKTVGYIRKEYEKYFNTNLLKDIIQQEKILFNKIRNGSSKNFRTVNLSSKMLRNDQPISRSTWQMLTKLNPKNCPNPIQYVLWCGKKIRVTGSCGGENKYISNIDLGNNLLKFVEKHKFKNNFHQKRSLLKTSLVDFKPGPLSRKTNLDRYHLKNVGATELVELPKIGLDIQPSFGVPIEPTISNILHTLRDENGTLTKKWAVFALSTFASIKNNKILQNDKKRVTFDLNFKNHQNKILMLRNDIKNLSLQKDFENYCEFEDDNETKDYDTIKNLVNDLLKAVEISVIQDNLCIEMKSSTSKFTSKVKLKNKYIELKNLDVTIRKLSENIDNKHKIISCYNSFCRLGCICSSLACRYNFKRHCSRIDCMFECKCDFSKYKAFSALKSQCTDFIPGLLSYQKLAKVENKFHQTVVLTKNNRLLLEAQGRNLRSPKDHVEYLNTDCLKSKCNKKCLSISAIRLDCSNIETWCMVHNLYRCFCKGRFIECLSYPTNGADATCTETTSSKGKIYTTRNNIQDYMKLKNISDNKLKSKTVKRKSSETLNKDLSHDYFDSTLRCARTKAFKRRKFYDSYYLYTNRKIKEMEQNDKTLHERLMSHVKIKDLEYQVIESDKMRSHDENNVSDIIVDKKSDEKQCPPRYFESIHKLMAWLKLNYKKYEECLENGLTRFVLESPKPGKIALYPWEFILHRYQMQKNYFAVTQEKPYRIFVAVDLNKSFFINCDNISFIRSKDVSKYPVTVINLLNMVTMKDSFVIMYGLQDCWELFGPATKLGDKNINEEKVTSLLLNTTTDDFGIKEIKENIYIADDYSKWFCMVVENDFDEMQFQNRGYFVKYSEIIHAIHLARKLSKTIKLAPHDFFKDTLFPQFGLYALPIFNEFRVCVGPYNKYDNLGIYTTLNVSSLNAKRSRGVWMITNKKYNIKVIDDPLYFLPDIDNSDEIITINQNNKTEFSSTITSSDIKQLDKKESKVNNDNIIIKTNKNLPILSQFSLLESPTNNTSQELNPAVGGVPVIQNTFSFSNSINTIYEVGKIRPIAELVPQKKEYFTSLTDGNSKLEICGMFFSKPKEINKKNTGNSMLVNANKTFSRECFSNYEIDKDIEKFLATFKIYADDVSEISDGETDKETTEVWIECVNIHSLGCIKGKRNFQNELSFKFPGFKFTDFYDEAEAFLKINQVLSRKVFVSINPEWHVVELKDNLRSNRLQLNSDYFGPNFILTKHGFLHKNQVPNNVKLEIYGSVSCR